MKIYRYRFEGSPAFGIEHDGHIMRVAASSIAEVPEATLLSSKSVHDKTLDLLAPVQPGKIIGIGRNYADHAKELGNEAPAEPLIFLKPPSCVVGPGGPVKLPAVSSRVDFEGELAIVVGRKARNIKALNWRDYVLGFTCANDVTARDLQKKDVQFTRAKGFDTFCPIGPFVNTSLDVSDLQLKTSLNGEVKQQGRTSQMIFGPAELMEYVSGIMTLEPGDVILTGTPSGVGPMNAGDSVTVEIDGLGALTNHAV